MGRACVPDGDGLMARDMFWLAVDVWRDRRGLQIKADRVLHRERPEGLAVKVTLDIPDEQLEPVALLMVEHENKLSLQLTDPPPADDEDEVD